MTKIHWLYNRMRLMPYSELLFRIMRSVMQRIEKHRVSAGWQPSPKKAVSPKMTLFGADLEIITQWRAEHNLAYERLDLYMAGRIDFFGHKYLETGMPVSWLVDPMTKTSSPLNYGKSLDYRDDKIVGNVKFLWELGRHQHLVPLAVAYAVTGELKYRDSVTSQIDDWIKSNPFAMGIHWCSSLEVSLRLISWSLVHSLIAIRDGENGLFNALDSPEQFGLSIYQQAYFVRNYLSLYSSANNHLIGELAGLWTACQVFDLGINGAIWSEFAQKELEKQSCLQVHDDGVNKEQAVCYHLWVLDYFLLVWLIGCRASKRYSPKFLDKLIKMAEFVHSITPENGRPPQFGDSDDGVVARFEPYWPERPFSEILSVFDELFGASLNCSSQKAFWYRSIASEGFSSRLCRAGTRERKYPEVYRQGGYAILGNSEVHLVFDGGDLGYLAIAAHGHADALSFCLAIDGDWWLVDPGTYAYHSGPRWRNYFRGTSAHNTIRINKRDQSKIVGAFMWSQKTNARIDSVTVHDGWQLITASHDGYAGIGVSHQRTLAFNGANNDLTIEDFLNCVRGVQAEIHFHFSPDVSLRYDENQEWWVARHRNSSRSLILVLDKIWTVDAVKGCEDPILGWYSSALEEKVPTFVLRGSANVSGRCHCITRIVIQ